MNKAFLLFLFGIVLCLPAHGQFAAVSRGPLSGNCNPHTLGIDYLANNVYSCDGSPAQWKLIGAAAVLTPSGTKAIPNCNAAGTVVNQTVQESSQTVNGVTTTCATVGAIGSTSVIGVCSVLGVCGTLGTAIVGTANTMPCIFDNSATVGDYVVPSSSVTGFCSDIGPTKPTSAIETLGNVYQANNGGSGTIGYVEVAPLSLLLPGSSGTGGGGGGGAGSINNCSQVGAIAYYSGLNIISCDLQFTTNGVGTFTAVGGIFTGAGAGFMAQVQGTAPSLSLSNAVYLFPPSSVSATYGLSWPGSLPTNGDCVKFGVSGSVAQFLDAGAGCNTSSASVTSVGLSINSASSSGPFAVTGSPVTSSGTLNLNATLQGTDTSLLSSGTVSGTGKPLCTDANGGATTSGCAVSLPGAGTLLNPSAPTLTVNGTTGATQYCYVVIGSEDAAATFHSAASSQTCVSNGNATLSSSNSITLSAYIDTTYGYRGVIVCRVTGGATQGVITNGLLAGKKFIDTGLTADGSNCATTYASNTTFTWDACMGSSLPGNPSVPGAPCGVDGPPLTPTAFDDEATQTFGAPGDANDPFWAWLNQGSATASWSNGALILTPDTGSTGYRLLLTPAPASSPWTFVAQITPHVPVNFGRCGLALEESATGKMVEITFQQEQPLTTTATDNGIYLEIKTWSNSTTSADTQFTSYQWLAPVYFKAAYDGTHVTFSYSQDGVGYSQLWTATATSWFTSAPNRVGFESVSGSSTVPTVCDVDYIRRTQ